MRPLFHHIRGHGLLLALMLMVGGIVLSASQGLLPDNLRVDASHMEKQRLLSYLSSVNAVGWDPDALLLFSGGTPLMVVWVSSSPAELYRVDGSFVGRLNAHEYRRVLQVTRPLVGDHPGGVRRSRDRFEPGSHVV